MFCPKCGSKTRVVDSVMSEEEEEVYRKRVCEVCREMFYTTEFVVEYDEHFRRHFRDAQREKENRSNRRNGRREIASKEIPKYDVVLDLDENLHGKAFVKKVVDLGVRVVKVNADRRRYVSVDSIYNSLHQAIKTYKLPLRVFTVYKTTYLERTDM